MTRELFLKVAEEFAKENLPGETCKYTRAGITSRLADLLAKHAGEWIAVGERQPRGNVEVLVMEKVPDDDHPRIGSGIHVAWFVDGRFSVGEFGVEASDLSHWRPLPLCPKDRR